MTLSVQSSPVCVFRFFFDGKPVLFTEKDKEQFPDSIPGSIKQARVPFQELPEYLERADKYELENEGRAKVVAKVLTWSFWMDLQAMWRWAAKNDLAPPWPGDQEEQAQTWTQEEVRQLAEVL